MAAAQHAVEFDRAPKCTFPIAHLRSRVAEATTAAPQFSQLFIERCRMVKEIAERIVGVMIVGFWVAVVTATSGIVVAAAMSVIQW
jgi:hypothetical protein